MNLFNTYKSQRRLVQTLTTIVIVALPFLNIIRLDIPTLRFYFFNSVLWLDEFYLLFLVIMLMLWIIVIFTMQYGRIWSGWMCPQTVLNELIRWFENKVKRWFRISKQRKGLVRSVGAYSVISFGVAFVSILIAFNLVAYFVDPYHIIGQILPWSLSPVTAYIMLSLALLMFLDIMFWREKVCTKVCPYGLMQNLIMDEKTLRVRYQTERAEDCIECGACVRDCIMGIDIRHSPYQMECIHCGDCIDSCQPIMDRLGKPNFISFSREGKRSKKRWYHKIGPFDIRRGIVFSITTLFALMLTLVAYHRQPVSLAVVGDRYTLFREGEQGSIYNDYKLKISNRSLEDGIFRIECSLGNPGEDCELHIEDNPVFLKSREIKSLPFSISTLGTHLQPGPNKMELIATNVGNQIIRSSIEAVFFMPDESFDAIPTTEQFQSGQAP